MSTVRIPPIDPPYDDETQQLFDRIMPPGMAPLNIFRTYARHPKLFQNVMARGGMLLYEGELSHRDREIVLHRTCARCGSEYEWGVHVTAFARPLGFSEEEIRATAIGGTRPSCWRSSRWRASITPCRT
jgi:alkylhydroperoxidase family enzyme